MSGGKVWSLILAAGEGSRLSSLTTTAAGLSVPKQFCSLRGGASLLEEALARGEAVTPRHHALAVVAESHRRWWEAPLWLRVLTVPDCGWSDLGTPRRVAETLARIGPRHLRAEAGCAYVNPAGQQARQPLNAHPRAHV